MKKIAILSVLFTLVMVVGCAKNKKPAASAVTDIAPPPPVMPTPVAVAPAPAPIPEAAPIPNDTLPGGPMAGRSYTVKRGDTLWGHRAAHLWRWQAV